ncbi:MAG: F0F1 ATP synthase subunit gamma [Alphaproteobacteria bacterium]
MPSLKDLKVRIKSVKSTQKITKAMKMVAAAKLRRAKDAAENARPYAQAMERMVSSLAASAATSGNAPALLAGTGKDAVHLVVVATSDRGLCGGFNSTIVRATRRKIRELQVAGKTVKILCVGRKGYEQLQLEFGKLIEDKITIKSRRVGYADAEEISSLIMQKFEAGEFDVAHIVYNHFKSAIAQTVTWQQLIPLAVDTNQAGNISASPYDYEPEESEILVELLPRNLGVQVFRALLENAASEQGSRMTAMDNATRNAGDMIKKLNLKYNRTRQAAITKELIEIISGAEAV